MLDFTWDVPMRQDLKVSATGTDVCGSDNNTASRVAWEAMNSEYAKMSYLFNTRYNRSIPTWELQAPENGFNLSTLLQVLEEVDESCVLTVRKIHKIGLNSAQILRDYFSQFGEVDRVMLLPSRPKASAGSLNTPLSASKIRPASMAFVVMRSRQPAIVARFHESHVVEGHPIQVQIFKRDPAAASMAPDATTPTTTDGAQSPHPAPEIQLSNWLDDMSSMLISSYRTSAKFIN